MICRNRVEDYTLKINFALKIIFVQGMNSALKIGEIVLGSFVLGFWGDGPSEKRLRPVSDPAVSIKCIFISIKRPP
ncbi:MAG: hypothetical protein LBD54_03070, partial [Puniceicoccales bacterium]|nr:hypothetical protein [Puniceicoccales bacterium]